jgi:hypothetical protein
MFKSPFEAVPPAPALFSGVPPACPPPPPLAVIVVIDSVPDATDEFPPAVPLLLVELPPPPPPPTTVTFNFVIPVGIVNVPLAVNTCPLTPVADNGATADSQVVPLEVSTLPLVPGATNLTGFVPSPNSTFSAVKADTPVDRKSVV